MEPILRQDVVDVPVGDDDNPLLLFINMIDLDEHGRKEDGL